MGQSFGVPVSQPVVRVFHAFETERCIQKISMTHHDSRIPQPPLGSRGAQFLSFTPEAKGAWSVSVNFTSCFLASISHPEELLGGMDATLKWGGQTSPPAVPSEEASLKYLVDQASSPPFIQGPSIQLASMEASSGPGAVRSCVWKERHSSSSPGAQSVGD